MFINIKDLKKGDEILIPFKKGVLFYCKVLKDPALRTKPQEWSGIIEGYKMIKLSLIYDNSWNRLRNDNNSCIIENHTDIKYIYLNYSDIWLVKREGELI